jgi:hypothetical protein
MRRHGRRRDVAPHPERYRAATGDEAGGGGDGAVIGLAALVADAPISRPITPFTRIIAEPWPAACTIATAESNSWQGQVLRCRSRCHTQLVHDRSGAHSSVDCVDYFLTGHDLLGASDPAADHNTDSQQVDDGNGQSHHSARQSWKLMASLMAKGTDDLVQRRAGADPCWRSSRSLPIAPPRASNHGAQNYEGALSVSQDRTILATKPRLLCRESTSAPAQCPCCYTSYRGLHRRRT